MIVRTDKNKNYTTLCNIALNDPELSLKAKGLFAYLDTRPANYRINYRQLMTELREGQSAILAALRELEVAGLVERELVRGWNGRIESQTRLVR